MTQPTNKSDVDRLNAMLRGERAAVETYGKCIEKLATSSRVAQLTSLKASHAGRVGKLTGKVVELGGSADMTSGAWGSFANLVESGAAVFGEKSAIGALEEGEDHGKKDYADLEGLSEGARRFVQTELVSRAAPHARRAERDQERDVGSGSGYGLSRRTSWEPRFSSELRC